MNNRMDKGSIRVFQDMHKHVTTKGLNPKYMWFDNEASPASQCLLKENCIDCQLVYQAMHRRNAEERVISTFKDNFIAWL